MTPKTDHPLPTAVQRFIDTTNSQDTDGFVAAFTEDAFLDDWGRGFSGHEGVRSWDGTDNIGVNAHFDLVSWHQGSAENVVIVVLTVSGDGYNGTGPMEFTLDDDRISRLIISDSVG
ncbi:nuclear transport factor 2 family protein [Microbacterium maritypicum]|uniref:nuclear transport factor 2 family protein n=1 Tax=Microbacterium maritypicum TaxID=33918 RepID=UPI0038111604